MTLLVGNNTQDGTTSGGNPDTQQVYKFVAAESGTVTSARVMLGNDNQGNFKLVAWAADGDAGGGSQYPGTLLGVTDEVAGGTYSTNTEISANFSSSFSVTQGTEYWIGIHRDGFHNLLADSTLTDISKQNGTDTYSDGTSTTWVQDTGGPDDPPYLYLDGTVASTGPTINSAPSTLVRTGTGYTIDVTSDDTSGHTVDLENSGGTTVESQTVNSITDNGDGTVTINFDVNPGALTIGATDHVLRVTDTNGNDTQTGITLRHPRVYVQAEADDGSNLSAGASWWARESEDQAPVDSGSVNFDGNGVGLLTFANTSVAPGGSLIVDSKYNGDARRAISDLTIE